MNLETDDLPQLFAPQREWHSMRGADVLADKSGKILGEVRAAIGGGYHATADGRHLGVYITSDAAKRAVEANARG